MANTMLQYQPEWYMTENTADQHIYVDRRLTESSTLSKRLPLDAKPSSFDSTGFPSHSGTNSLYFD